MSSKAPLWKQLTGAIAGAAIAVVVYQAFLYTAPVLQALVTLPSAPGVDQQDEVRTSGAVDVRTRERMELRNAEIAERFAGTGFHAAASSSRAAGLRAVIDSARSILGTAGSSSSTASSVASSGTGQASSSSVSSYTYVAPVQRAASSSATYVAPVVTKAPVRTDHLPQTGVGLWIVGCAAFGAAASRHRLRKAGQNDDLIAG